MKSAYTVTTLMIATAVAGLLCWPLQKIYNWKSPDVNWNRTVTLHDAIYKFPHHELMLHSMGTDFKVAYVEHSSPEAVNPYFPSIHSVGDADYSGWLQVVYTDHSDKSLQTFIDSAVKSDWYPFYSLGKKFYDAPHWTYTLRSKAWSFLNWKGHAYAVRINDTTQTITCCGGIEWGFRLTPFRLRPQALVPRVLSQEDWDTDFKVFDAAIQAWFQKERKEGQMNTFFTTGTLEARNKNNQPIIFEGSPVTLEWYKTTDYVTMVELQKKALPVLAEAFADEVRNFLLDDQLQIKKEYADMSEGETEASPEENPFITTARLDRAARVEASRHGWEQWFDATAQSIEGRI